MGGQLTAQGVCTPDENRWIEMGGATASYQSLRRDIRAHYARNHRLSPAASADPLLNPGRCWVSRISVEPRVAEGLLRERLNAYANLTVMRGVRAVGAEIVSDRIETVRLMHGSGETMTVRPRMVLDATDLGDLLPITGAEYWLGAEGIEETGEPDAPPVPRPDWIQPCTVPFAVELRPFGEDHTIRPPEDYADLRELQRYHVLDGAMRSMFGEFGWWSYRRVIASENFDDPAFPRDIAMINTGANDYRGGALPSDSSAAAAAHLARARRVSLGYLYWLQTECPREDRAGTVGYPELRLRGDWFDTSDGLPPEPYIRESRRLVALKTVREQDIVHRDGQGRQHQPGPRARPEADSVGIGHYWLDVHEGGSEEPGRFLETQPYQIPAGALAPIRLRNLIAACKNLGVTHLASGAFRLHPVEWAVGEAAGALGALAASLDLDVQDVVTREPLLRRLQERLLADGAPIYWWGDLSPGSAVWKAAQWLGIRGIWPEETAIEFRADEPASAEMGSVEPDCRTRGELALRLVGEAASRTGS